MCTPSIEARISEGFAQKMLGALNGAALTLMTSVGHRTGLFDRMAELPPCPAARIAREAGLSERYVREWLGAMVTGGVVEYDPASGAYWLPPEHAACLTRASSPDNLAVTAQWIAVLGSAEDRVVDAFAHGRGVPYDAYPRFHAVMAEESNQTTLAGLLDHILPLVPGLVQRLREGIQVLDVGCGSGRAVNALASTFPASRFTGMDFSGEGIARANAEAREAGLSNASFAVRDVATMDVPGVYDLVTAFDAIHDQAQPAAVLRNIARSLREGGVFLMQDIAASSRLHENVAQPMAPFIYTISCMHCMSVSLASQGAGLGAAWGRELATQMLHEAGFSEVRVEQLPHDIQNYYYVAR